MIFYYRASEDEINTIPRHDKTTTKIITEIISIETRKSLKNKRELMKALIEAKVGDKLYIEQANVALDSVEQLQELLVIAQEKKIIVELNSGIAFDYSKKTVTKATQAQEALLKLSNQLAKRSNGTRISIALSKKGEGYRHGKRAIDIEYIKDNFPNMIVDIESNEKSYTEIGKTYGLSRQTIAKYAKIISEKDSDDNYVKQTQINNR